jgi:hypothetical protein
MKLEGPERAMTILHYKPVYTPDVPDVRCPLSNGKAPSVAARSIRPQIDPVAARTLAPAY